MDKERKIFSMKRIIAGLVFGGFCLGLGGGAGLVVWVTWVILEAFVLKMFD